MSLEIITNPAVNATNLKAGFEAIDFIMKREDLAIIDIEAGTGGIKINHVGDLSSYLTAGDSVYVYAEGTNYVYDGIGKVVSVVSTELTLDIPFIEAAAGGYINYFKSYYAEMQLVHPNNDDINLLPFTLQSDGDAAGNVIFDLSIINDLNSQVDVIANSFLTESRKEFQIKYRQVYTGSSESFVLISNKNISVLYTVETPEQDEIINGFEVPKLYLGYDSALIVAHLDTIQDLVEVIYNVLDANNTVLDDGTLGEISENGNNGLYMFKFDGDTVISETAKYLEFTALFTELGEYDATDYNATEYST